MIKNILLDVDKNRKRVMQMKMKVLLGVIGAAFLILSLPSVSALTAKEVLKKVNEDVSLPATGTGSNNTTLEKLWKYFFLVIWTIAAGIVTTKDLLTGNPRAILDIIAWIGGAIYILFFADKFDEWISSHLPQ